MVIHENRGLSDWVRSIADGLAEAGYLAVAPDLLTGTAPGGGKTSDFPNSDAARQAIYKLNPDQITSDLDAIADTVSALPAANGKLAVVGFCWGGSQTFRFATNSKMLSGAFVFYGRGPTDIGAITRISCPVYGFYGGDDARVNATIPDTEKLMQEARKVYEPVIYEGARHGFLRRGQSPDANDANKSAARAAWKRLVKLLSASLN